MVEASDKDMVEPCGAEIKNLAFEGCLWSLGFQCMTRNFLVSLYSKFNQFFRCIISSEIPLLNFFLFECKLFLWYLHSDLYQVLVKGPEHKRCQINITLPLAICTGVTTNSLWRLFIDLANKFILPFCGDKLINPKFIAPGILNTLELNRLKTG